MQQPPPAPMNSSCRRWMSAGGRVSVYKRSQKNQTHPWLTWLLYNQPPEDQERCMTGRLSSCSFCIAQFQSSKRCQRMSHKISIHSAGVITVSAVFWLHVCVNKNAMDHFTLLPHPHRHCIAAENRRLIDASGYVFLYYLFMVLFCSVVLWPFLISAGMVCPNMLEGCKNKHWKFSIRPDEELITWIRLIVEQGNIKIMQGWVCSTRSD